MRNAPFAVVAATVVVCCTWSARANAQTTQPAAAKSGATTRPTGKSAEEMLNQLLRPTPRDARPPAATGSAPTVGGIDATSGTAAVAPGAPVVTVLREGTDIVNRVGRLARSPDGQQWEFLFESDGRTMLDPPLIILPNLNLMKMEMAAGGTSRDVRFRVTGEVTEYRGRNYVLLRKASVVSEAEKQF